MSVSWVPVRFEAGLVVVDVVDQYSSHQERWTVGILAKNLAALRCESFQELLVCFLYTLMRDDVVAGRVEELVMGGESHPPPYKFSNPHLEAYARELAARLIGDGSRT